MKIAEIAPVWFTVPPRDYGGIELVVANLTEGLLDRGHDVTLFASGGSRTKGRLVSPMPEAPGLELRTPTWEEPYHALSSYLEAGEFEVVHDHTWFGPALGAMLGGVPPVVHTLHGAWNDLSRSYYSLLHRRIHLVAISEAQRKQNDDLVYAAVIHHGIDLDAYPLAREKDEFLLFLGRCDPEKGPDLAVEVAKRAGMHLKMVMKRSEPVERDYWDQVVAPRLRGDEEVLDPPSHEVKVDLLGRAKATLFPIRWHEPFGLVMVESMACGTPVLAHPMGAAAEVIVDGVTGWLCETGEEMVEAIGRVDQLSPAACRRHVIEGFSVRLMVERYEALMERVVRESRE